MINERLSFQEFDDFHRKRLTELIEQAKEPFPVVCSFYDLMGNGSEAFCSKCGTTVSIRPWLLDLAKKHNLPIVCISCVDPIMLHTQLEKDLREIRKA